ncbi:hypothetical protein QBC38DRAFT_523801 [Podospora fimiseda]|uniref:Uncharacterized protein n=1 Tax=Podospora fimiseda TaxID=252190 RepID=A0AAN7BS55_9PEZI|nr:hypothetical protein QBC38DRAFT_523801 [Podospora fimiseda]
MSLPTLPQINSSTRFPQSCASISLQLLTYLDTIFPQPPFLTLSIGSGPGLLEALLLYHFPLRSETFFGVEVSSQVNRYLSKENVIIVNGTWDIVDPGTEEKLQGKEEVKGLIFVYPREVKLVERYLREKKKVEVVVWIGPRCDEEGFERVLGDWGVREEEVKGLVEDGEVVGVWRRRKV